MREKDAKRAEHKGRPEPGLIKTCFSMVLSKQHGASMFHSRRRVDSLSTQLGTASAVALGTQVEQAPEQGDGK